MSSVTPASGKTSGGTAVAITGTNLTGTTAVTFGGVPATSFTVNNDTSITALTPPHAAGSVTVAITTPAGQASLVDSFAYALSIPTMSAVSPGNGPSAGGSAVEITGTNFIGVTAVTFGGVAATSFTVKSDTLITATTPPHAAGSVNVAITTPAGQTTLPDAFAYAQSAPKLKAVSPSGGPSEGGTTVEITGTGFKGTKTVSFGSVPASYFAVNSDTSITAVTPAHAKGVVSVDVKTPGGKDTLVNAFNYTVRPDPSLDPEVSGLLNAQYQSVQRLAKTQISIFRDRLEQLHDDSARQSTSWGIQLRANEQTDHDMQLGFASDKKLNAASRATRNILSGQDRPEANAFRQPATLATDFSFWTGGFVNFGSSDKNDLDLSHTLVGVSGGVDYRFSSTLTAGVGFGYGKDKVDIGSNGTESDGKALSAAFYGSYRPVSNVFLDGLVGYSALDFGSERFVTTTGDFASGDRSGNQIFGSISIGYEHKSDAWLISPYGRIEAARSRLDAFTETGAGIDNLAFGKQTMDMLASVAGLRTQYIVPQPWGQLLARGRIEYTHDFNGSSRVSMGYADLGANLPYFLDVTGFTKDYVSLGLGLDAGMGERTTLGFDYTTGLGFDGNSQSHNTMLRLGVRF
ncbi:autotransporter domain-containing protein [Ochrobactrum sp. GPK 3]